MSWRTTRAAGHAAQSHRQVAVDRPRLQLVAAGRVHLRPGAVVEAHRRALRDGPDRRRASAPPASSATRRWQRGLETLAVFERFCRANRIAPPDVHAVATSAIRDAANGAALPRRGRAAPPGWRSRSCRPQDEAHFGYVAAVNTTTLTRRRRARPRRRQPAADPRSPTASAGRCVSFPLGAVRITEEFLPGGRPGQEEGARARARARRRGARRRSTGWPPRARGWSGSAARCATWPPPPSRSTAALDLGVQGFVIAPDALGELVARAGRAARRRARRGPGDQARPRRHHPRRRAGARDGRASCGGFDGIEATEAGLREGVFLARTLLAGSEPLFDDVRVAAVRNLAIQYESDMAHVEHVAALSLQMFDSLVAGGAVRARRRRARAAVGGVDAPRRRDDDLLRRPPQALALPDRERRAARLRSRASAR